MIQCSARLYANVAYQRPATSNAMIFILNAACENCKSPFDVSHNLVGFRFIKRTGGKCERCTKTRRCNVRDHSPKCSRVEFLEFAKHEHWNFASKIDLPKFAWCFEENMKICFARYSVLRLPHLAKLNFSTKIWNHFL